ncbi:hypothetical protein ENSA5_57870 [Enhygromyxa salina]|uniref:Uncharacterized protein n=1 Tax=Enhygromyxa salina TaxID=215803 RepID=A0A2S9XEI8_9BACT|nr:hypothetical protein [Enhygromyxa salina]PRP91170.1 hypothetical protein ENSA5_57870 [Enhygromyxa salina]
MRINLLADPHGRGMMRQSIAGRHGARWVEANLEAIELIERKAYNRGDLGENLALAFGFPARIAVD